MHIASLPQKLDPLRVADALGARPGFAWLDGESAGVGDGSLGTKSYFASDFIDIRHTAFAADDELDFLLGLTSERDEAGPTWARAAPRWIGYVGYDFAWQASVRREPRLVRDAHLPTSCFARYDAVLALEHGSGRAHVVGDDEAACARLIARLGGGAGALGARARAGSIEGEETSTHARAIERAIEHIYEGDIYQVNLARMWRAPFEGSALALFCAMREASPVPLGMFFDAPAVSVSSRSMERFLRWDRATGRIESRPIKGTIRRSGEEDARDAAILRRDEKEQAEHAMIVDLMRNDLGRIARAGSVRVEEVMKVEPYAKLSHLVSTVAAEVREGVSFADVLRATFAPGSVTGAPKVRAMQIIEDLERSARGVYTGAIGYVDREGGASLAVAIRTATVQQGEVRYYAGGGIVVDSVPEREVAETELKARVFFDALAALELR